MQVRSGALAALMVLCGAACADSSLVEVSPELSVSPSRLELPETWVGVPAEGRLSLVNRGGAPLRHLEVEVVGAGFALVGPLPHQLAVGEKATLVVRFVAEEAGTFAGRLGVSATGEASSVALAALAKPVPDCDDRNPCTEDRFVSGVGGCRHTAVTGACDDGNACTTEDRCHAGACVGRPLSCDDGLACTHDACAPMEGCVHEVACDDGNACTVDGCGASGACSHAPAHDDTLCGDATACALALCRSGTCESVPIAEGAACDDGDPCTRGDVCRAGTCAATPLDCDDEDPCTADACDAEGRCTHDVLSSGTPCGEQTTCERHVCIQGQCTPTGWALSDWVWLWQGRNGVAFADDATLVALDDGILTVVDLSGPTATVTATGRTETVRLNAAGRFADGSIVVSGCWPGNELSTFRTGLQVLRADGSGPIASEVAFLPEDSRCLGDGADLEVHGRFAYATGADRVLRVLERRSNGRLELMGSVASSVRATAVEPDAGALFIVARDSLSSSVVSRWSLEAPEAPRRTHEILLPNCGVDDTTWASASRAGLVVGCHWEFVILDSDSLALVGYFIVSDPERPEHQRGWLAWLDDDHLVRYTQDATYVLDGSVRIVAILRGVTADVRPKGATMWVHDASDWRGVNRSGHLARWSTPDWTPMPAHRLGPGGVPRGLGSQLWTFGPHGHRVVEVTDDGDVRVGATHFRPETLVRSDDLEGGPFLDLDPTDTATEWSDPVTGARGAFPDPGDVDVFSVGGNHAWSAANRVYLPDCGGCTALSFAPVEGVDDLGPWTEQVWGLDRGDGDREGAYVSEIRPQAGGIAVLDCDGGWRSYAAMVQAAPDGLASVGTVVSGNGMSTSSEGTALSAEDLACFHSWSLYHATTTAMSLSPDVATVGQWSAAAAEVRSTGDHLVGFDGHAAVLYRSGLDLVQVLDPVEASSRLQTVAVPSRVNHAKVLPNGVLVTGDDGVGMIVPLCPD